MKITTTNVSQDLFNPERTWSLWSPAGAGLWYLVRGIVIGGLLAPKRIYQPNTSTTVERVD